MSSQAPISLSEPAKHESIVRIARSILVFMAVSVMLLVPCIWQPQVGIGDFPSHIYNAWLATLIEQGKLPGMALAHLKTNVLVDSALVWSLKRFSVPTSERLVLGASVLIFFWGVFALAYPISRKGPWSIAPVLAVFAYGVIFQLGFSNFYLATGISSLALALLLDEEFRWWRFVGAFALFLLAWKAHTFPVGWALATFVYVSILRRLPHRRLQFFLFACVAVIAGSLVLTYHFQGVWLRPRLLLVTGAGQAALHGPLFAFVGLGFLLILCAQFASQIRQDGWKAWLQLPEAQLYLLAVIAGVCMPLTFRIGQSAIGVVTERLSLFAAIFACMLLPRYQLRRPLIWTSAAFCGLFFLLLFFDARAINQLESKLETMVATLPPDSRVAALLQFPETRLQSSAGRFVEHTPGVIQVAEIFYDPGFGVNIHHIIDRACIRRCISYANYEPATYQFQVRALPGSRYALREGSESGKMQMGDYQVKEDDLPLYQIYPCGPFAVDLCGRWLRAGEINGAENYHAR
jgi:hypothetical protein